MTNRVSTMRRVPRPRERRRVVVRRRRGRRVEHAAIARVEVSAIARESLVLERARVVAATARRVVVGTVAIRSLAARVRPARERRRRGHAPELREGGVVCVHREESLGARVSPPARVRVAVDAPRPDTDAISTCRVCFLKWVDSRHVASWFQLESENPMKANSKTVLTVDEKNARVNPHQ